MAAGHELLDQVRVGAVLGEPGHVVVVIGLGVGAEIGFRQLAVGEIGHERAEVFRPVEDHPHGASGISAVAAALLFRRSFQQSHVGAGLGRSQRCRERGVAAAHDHDIGRQRLGHSAARWLSRDCRAVQSVRRTSRRACRLLLPGTRVHGASGVLVFAIMSLAASS